MFPLLQLNARQRRLLIGIIAALSSQFYLPAWAEGFRVSAAAILYPALLVTLTRDSHRPDTGLVTGFCITGFRTLVDLIRGTGLVTALLVELPGGLFYLCYDILLCLLIRDRRSASRQKLLFTFFLCDALSNAFNLFLSSGFVLRTDFETTAVLLWLALGRSVAAVTILWIMQSYQQLLLQEEHEQRYRRLFLMTAGLKTELYFLKKDAEDIEAVMSHAYQLYEKLEQQQISEELTSLALSIARDVHEVKKDNLRIIRGLEEEVAEVYDHEVMSLSDLLTILEISTRQFLGAHRANIRLECFCRVKQPVREHYRLLSILKNLVTNAVEAIQSASGQGTVRVDIRQQNKVLLLTVSDNGPGISPRARKILFEVGYSTKFNPETGDINRGVGLPAVQFIVDELGGSISVDSQIGEGTTFQISLPMDRLTGGSNEDLHH